MTDTPTGGWPDDASPGVPLNPERDGAHWIIGWNNSPFVAEWQADPNAEFGGDYGWYDGGDRPDGIVANGWTYGGPCLTPSEVTAREAAAFAAGAEAMREMAKHAVDGIDTADVYSSGERHAAEEMRGFAKFLIRALPIPPMPGTHGGNADE